MARGKKNGGRGDGRAPHGGRGGGRHSHGKAARGRGSGRVKAPVNNGPSAAFLAALEAQRAKQAAEEAVVQPSSTPEHGHTLTTTNDAATARTSDTPPTQPQRSKRPALPGFVFDEERGRYFKLTKQDEQQQKKKRRADAIAQAQAAERKARFESRSAITGQLTKRRCGWMGRLAQREISNAPALRDRSGLLPRYYGARLSNHELRSVDVPLDAVRDRFTAMDVNADASRIYVGYSSGCIRSFFVNETTEVGQRELEDHLSLSIHASTISAIRCHPRLPGVILFSAIGAGVAPSLTTLLPRGSNDEEMSGRVTLLSDAIVDRPPLLWRFPDPWTAEWSPADDASFSVGLHGDVGAAIVDGNFVGTPGRGVSYAPTGKITSDTLSQAFYPHSSSVVANGSRDGSWWQWDTRSPRRASECFVDKKAKSIGALQCVRVLSDERRMVLQRSNGELSVMDLRSPRHSVVTQFSSGVKDLYRTMPRFDVDESESVVVAAMGNSVDVFDLHGGNELAHVRLLHDSVSTTNGTPDQVFLRDAGGCPTLWALSRSGVYRSSLMEKK